MRLPQAIESLAVDADRLALQRGAFGEECNLPRTHEARGKSVLVERSLKEGRGALLTGRDVGGDCFRTLRAHNTHHLRHEFVGHTLERGHHGEDSKARAPSTIDLVDRNL